MAVWLKRGVTAEIRADLDRKVRDTVEMNDARRH